MLVFGIIEIGRAIMVQQIITNGAREGARRAIVPGATDAKVEAVVNQHMAAGKVTGFSQSVTPLASAESGDAITVNVSVPYSEVSWGVLNWLSGVTLSAEVVMRKE
ncbi:TadE/TadG family type IV pilus assembly protein [Roseiconus nitratireducens]|nr:TadE/TadG family type IV pilus assembly protein [Roseiconus nitratireducens]